MGLARKQAGHLATTVPKGLLPEQAIVLAANMAPDLAVQAVDPVQITTRVTVHTDLPPAMVGIAANKPAVP